MNRNLKKILFVPTAAVGMVLLADGAVPEAIRALFRQVPGGGPNYYLPVAALTIPAVAALAVLLYPLLGPGRTLKRNQCRRQMNLTHDQLCIIQARVQQFYTRHGRLPKDLAEVGFSQTMLTNPWGRPYVYQNMGYRYQVKTDLPEALYGEPNPEGQRLPMN